jgi:N-carbamoyl-L-amino-acid hydrolase
MDADTGIAGHVSEQRLWTDLDRNGAFGAVEGEGRGRTAPTGSDANRRCREYLLERMADAGLETRIDAVGNVVGRWEPPGASGPAVASGSHLDSVPSGGIFDGPLGVYAALEAVRAMQAAGADPDRPVEVVSFTEEEGATFGPGLLGSSVAAGARSIDEALAFESREGRTLGEALAATGFRGEGRVDAVEWDSWLELHVEQHTRLEAAGVPVGVVTDVTGITHCTATLEGAADHAGSTPMGPGRRDALAAASEVVLAVEEAAERRAEADPAAVGTVGRLDVSPNATNVVPGRAELGIDVRSVDGESVAALVETTEEALAAVEADRGVDTALGRDLDLDPTPMADRVQAAARAAGERAGVATTDCYSGAAHDTVHVARVTDAGMLFAPSRDGVSHSPLEWTEPADCAAATRLLAGALAELAGV